MKAAKKSAVTISLPEEIYLLAIDLDRFEWDYDPYGYRDSVKSAKENISYIEDSINKGDVEHIQKFIQEALDEYEELKGFAYEIGCAVALLRRLDNLVKLVKLQKESND